MGVFTDAEILGNPLKFSQTIVKQITLRHSCGTGRRRTAPRHTDADPWEGSRTRSSRP
ncbi:hypothetical protein GCM10020216_064800 [Nonomuraea helvata]